MIQSNVISHFVHSQVPDFYNRDAPDLVNFIKLYYQWMEQVDNPIHTTRQLLDYRDVDLVPEKHFVHIRNQIMANIPHAAADERLIAKNILDFYRSRGTEQSYRMLFRMIYNIDDIGFYYPSRDMLRISDGKWVVEQSLRLHIHVPVDSFDTVVQVRGLDSGTTARLDNFLGYLDNATFVFELFYTNADGEFIEGEQIQSVETGEILGEIWDIIISPGRYKNTDGFLSSDKRLQDNYYYQEFSYQINSSRSLLDYKKVAYELCHPTGTKLFGGVMVSTVMDFSADILMDIRVPQGVYRRVITYEFLNDFEHQEVEIDQIPYVEGVGEITINKRDMLTDWLDVPMMSISAWANLSLSDMDDPKFMDSDTPTFNFTDWSLITIKDNIGTPFYTYVRSVVSNTTVVINTPYTSDNASDLSYKYHILD